MSFPWHTIRKKYAWVSKFVDVVSYVTSCSPWKMEYVRPMLQSFLHSWSLTVTIKWWLPSFLCQIYNSNKPTNSMLNWQLPMYLCLFPCGREGVFLLKKQLQRKRLNIYFHLPSFCYQMFSLPGCFWLNKRQEEDMCDDVPHQHLVWSLTWCNFFALFISLHMLCTLIQEQGMLSAALTVLSELNCY